MGETLFTQHEVRMLRNILYSHVIINNCEHVIFVDDSNNGHGNGR